MRPLPHVLARLVVIGALTAEAASHHRSPIIGGVHVGYVAATVNIGTPPRNFDVILDTGSSRTVLPCVDCVDCGHEHAYDPARSSTARGTQHTFKLRYVEGSSLGGRYWSDVVVVGGDEARMDVGCASTMTKMFRTQAADGIAGLDDDPSSLVQALRAQHHSNTFGLRLCPGNRYFEVGRFHDEERGVQAPFHKRNGNYFVNVVGVGVTGEARLAHGARWLIDSGTTYMYVDSVVLAWVRRRLSKIVGPSDFRSDVGCVRSGASLPDLHLYLGNGASLRLAPAQYAYRDGGSLCVGVFATGIGNANTLGLIALEGRATSFDLVRDIVRFQNCTE